VNVGSPFPSSGIPGSTGWIRDVSGGFADLGTFLPLVIGLLVLGNYDACGMLLGFGVFAIATGPFYRRLLQVEPIKAVAASAITDRMSAAAGKRHCAATPAIPRPLMRSASTAASPATCGCGSRTRRRNTE
jgi:hypothetical protein